MRNTIIMLMVIFGGSFFGACRMDRTEKTFEDRFSDGPEWAKHAIWYQIFPERFRNGDPSNDPTIESLRGSWPFVREVDWELAPENWHITKWTEDWYNPDDYFQDYPDTGFYYGIQTRRYGGDLQGVIDKLDYLENLGINAIYFNPLNDSPSLHKYDAASYRHIDRHFGPDPENDRRLMNLESPEIPETWKWTSADLLFLKLLKECHQRGIKVIMDFSWNHTGVNFWAFQDVQKLGPQSKYKDWYYINEFDNRFTPEDEFKYKAWFGAETLPELKEQIVGETHEGEPLGPMEGDFYSKDLKSHIFKVTQRWMDPNGDGDPSDGVNGFRLDVAAEVPLGFWRDYRLFVKGINSEAYLVGEIWWEDWPDKLLNPMPFLVDAFDAVMNYRWYRHARSLFARSGSQLTPSQFVHKMDSISQGFSSEQNELMMNVAATHDSPRLVTSLFNKNRYKFNSYAKEDGYKVYKPDVATRQIQRLFLLHQYTYVGAPHIYYGDETGMWGADDPDCRKPMVWRDLEYADESHHPISGTYQRSYSVEVDTSLLAYYAKLIEMRKSFPVLRSGALEFITADDDSRTLIYKRSLAEKYAVICFNLGDTRQNIVIPFDKSGTYYDPLNKEQFEVNENELILSMEGQSGRVFILISHFSESEK